MPTTFSEYEAYAESIEDADFRLTLARLDRSQWSIADATLWDAIHLQAASEGSACIADGASQDGLVIFLQRPNDVSLANGVELSTGGAFLMPPGSEFYIVGQGPNGWTSIFIPNEVAESRGLPTSGSARVLEANGAAQALWHLVNGVISANETESAVTRERASCAAIEEQLLTQLEAMCGSGRDRTSPPRGRRRVANRRLVSSAVEMIEAGSDHIATVADLVAATGTAERTLREGFQKYLGMSPRRYLQLSRLHEARRSLARPRNDAVTVTEVAAEVGMWDFGRFARRYREAFGEVPSQTLMRARAG